MLSEACTFVDMVPPFRDLASKSMGSMIEMQKVQLYELGKSQGVVHVIGDRVLHILLYTRADLISYKLISFSQVGHSIYEGSWIQ